MKKQNYQKLEKELKEIDWQYIVNRRESLLFRSFTGQCYKYFKELTGISWSPTIIVRFDSGEMFYNKSDVDRLKNIFIKGGYKRLFKFANQLEKEIKTFYRISQKISRFNFKKATDAELFKQLNKYFTAILKANIFLDPLPIADKIISGQILELLSASSEEEAAKQLGVLVYPIKEHENAKEEIDFYKLAINYKKQGRDIDRQINKHLEKYAWLGTRGYNLGSEWTPKSLKERLDSFLIDKNPEKQLRQLIKIRKNVKCSAENLIKKLKIKKNSLAFRKIKLVQRYSFLRTWRTNTISKTGFLIRPLYYEIADRYKVSRENILFLDYKELIYLAKNKKLPISKLEIEKRKGGYITVGANKEYRIITEKSLITKVGKIIKPKQKIIGGIKGQIAYKGIIKGRARIVFNVNDMSKVCRGDILVAVMTFPNFVPAMEKAAAFVTDEGGILCHAAIIAREMKKPCIIATKNATKLLKDGNKIEVDANKGIVNILN